MASTSLGSVLGSATAGGQSIATASSAFALGTIATAATGSTPVVGTGSTTLATIASNSGAASAVRGAGSASLGAIVSASASNIPIGAFGSANLGGVRADGRCGALASGIASASLASIVGTAAARIGQNTTRQIVGPSWSLRIVPRLFDATASRRLFTAVSTGCKRMVNYPGKYAHEIRNASIDFAPALATGETLTGEPTVNLVKGNMTISGRRIDGSTVRFTLTGGSAAGGMIQRVEIYCSTSGDQVLEEVASVKMLS